MPVSCRFLFSLEPTLVTLNSCAFRLERRWNYALQLKAQAPLRRRVEGGCCGWMLHPILFDFVFKGGMMGGDTMSLICFFSLLLLLSIVIVL